MARCVPPLFVEYEAFPSGGRWPSEREGRMRANLPPAPRSRAIAANSPLIHLRAGPQTPSPSGGRLFQPSPHFQQLFPLPVIRQDFFHRRPKGGAVVRVGKVAEFMHHDIFLCSRRHHAEPLRKRQRAGAQAAGAPAGVHVAHGDFGHLPARAYRCKLRIVCPAQRLHMGQSLGFRRQIRLFGLLRAPCGGALLGGAHPVGAGRHKSVHIGGRHPRRCTGRDRAVRPDAQIDIAHPPPRQRVGNAARRALLHLLCSQAAAPLSEIYMQYCTRIYGKVQHLTMYKGWGDGLV